MMNKMIAAIVIVYVGLTSGTATAQAMDPNLKGLPPALQKAIAAETHGATIKSVSKEKEHGKVIYEVETLVNGRTRDVNFDANGAVLVVEEQSSLEAIPPAARAAIEQRATGGRLKTVELVTKNGKTTYEAIIVKGGKNIEVVVNSDGSAAK